MAASKAARRFRRSIALGILCLATLVWAAIEQFGIEPRVIGDFALATLLGLLGIIFVAALFVALVMGLRRLLGEKAERD